MILLSFFRAEAEKRLDGTYRRNIIYAIEEPETSQHPNNQKMLLDALKDIVELSPCQILLTTHTPVLAQRLDSNSLRYIYKGNNIPTISNIHDNNISEVITSIGVLPDHKVKAFIGVEGSNDIAFLKAISRVLYDHDHTFLNLSYLEEVGEIVFVPMGGSNLKLWAYRLNGFMRPQFYIMDRDHEPPALPKYQTEYDRFIEQGHFAWITGKKELENYLHPSVIRSEYPEFAEEISSFADVPQLFAKTVHEASASECPWDDILADPKKLASKECGAKKRLNSEFAQKMTFELLNISDPDGEIIAWFNFIKNNI